jgi:signal transduction histidine kinase
MALLEQAEVADTGKRAAGCPGARPGDHRVFDEVYRGFLELMAAQLATAIEQARAPEEGRCQAETLAALDAAKTSFFPNLSHEIRTPLTLLVGAVEEILSRKPSAEALRKAREEFEGRVHEWTQELCRANLRLERQIAKRKQAEEARARLLHRLVRAQEEERRHIARELHDDLTQRLAVLAIEAGKLEQAPGCPDEARRKARDMREQLVALSEGVHSLSRQLHPSILDDLGLVDALRAECLGMGQRDGIAVRFGTHGVPNAFSREVALCVYRVAQEALRNVARHAQTRRASVRLWANDRELILQVRDRGKGFDVAARGKAGLGLSSMRERVRLVRARLTVLSRPGEGTRVSVRVPLSRSSP